MIYGEKFLNLNEGFGGQSAEINKELDGIYKEGKELVQAEQKVSAEAFKAGNYSKVKTSCNKIISICEKYIKKLNAVNSTQMNGIGRAKRNKYVNYFTYMMDDAKVAIEEANKKK